MGTVFESGGRFEFEPRDLWFGIYWDKKIFHDTKIRYDVYIIIVPMFPYHLWFERPYWKNTWGIPPSYLL